MSTQQIAFASPFDPDETLTGERVGERYLPDTPYPLVRVRVDGSTLVVEQEDIR